MFIFKYLILYQKKNNSIETGEKRLKYKMKIRSTQTTIQIMTKTEEKWKFSA